MLREDGIDVRYPKQLKSQKLSDIIAQVIEKSNGPEIKVKVDDMGDPDGGGAYTIKKFTRKGNSVVLKARNPEYDITLENDAEYSQKYRAIAEFCKVLSDVRSCGLR